MGEKGEILQEYAYKRVNCAALGPLGMHVAIGHGKGAVVVHANTGETMVWPDWHRKGPPKADVSMKQCASVAFSRDGATLAAAGSDKKLRLVNMSTGAVQEVVHDAGGLSRVFCAAFNTDGTQVATGMEDGKARIIDVATGAVAAEIAHPSHVLDVCFDEQGTLATGCGDNHLRIFSAAGEVLLDQDMGGYVESVCFSPDSTLLAVAGHFNAARILDVKEGKVVKEFAHPRTVFAVAFCKDAEVLVTACQDGILRSFDVASGTVLKEIPHGGKPIRSLAFCVA